MTGDVRASRRRLALDGAGIAVSAGAFGLVYGLAARGAGFSLLEASAMSVVVFGGASQFAAVGYIAGGLAWPGIVLLTAFLNARHLLYSAALAPWLAARPRLERAAVAHFITDEAFALALSHFRRIGRFDLRGYMIAGVLLTFIPWNVATIAGVVAGSAIPEPERLGLDVVFPSAMAGLAVGLIAGRRDLVAAALGAVVGVGASLAVGPGIGIVAGGLIGPLVALVAVRGDPLEPPPMIADRAPRPAMAGPEDLPEALPEALPESHPDSEGAP